jgi:hypothetical protein
MTLTERLDALKANGDIAGYEAPHPNRGLSGGMLPWVIMPYNGGPASTYYDENHLELDIRLLELVGPVNFVLGPNMCRYGHGACE